MRIAFDPAKSERNLRERGFDFPHVAGIFLGRIVETVDDRRDYGERRILAIGEVAGDVLSVVYTDRGGLRRIISARNASRKERALWLSSA